MQPDDDLRHRAAVHAALGDPTRLAIVDELAVSDRSPGELAQRFELPTNLLAHHLDVLDEVGLIERTTSSGDRRRRYVRLSDDARPAPDRRRRRQPHQQAVLFVCTRNSARSPLAAALWQARMGTKATSAGTHPADEVHPLAVRAAARAGLDLGSVRPRAIERLRAAESKRQIITVCDQANEELAPDPDRWHWSIPDPVETNSIRAFSAAIDLLDDRLQRLAGIGAGTGTTA